VAGHRRAKRASARCGIVAAIETGGAVAEGDQAQHALLAADIKRFLERPAEAMVPMPAAAAPPGAPIGGDTGMDWLAPAPGCTWSSASPDRWLSFDWPIM
jgi:hypothetical protein